MVPNTLTPQLVSSGRAILVDLLTNQAGSFIVSRLPLRDDRGAVIVAIGMVLMDYAETTLQPLIAKFGRLERELSQVRAQLAAQFRPRYAIASFTGASTSAVEVKRQARRAALADSTVLLLDEIGDMPLPLQSKLLRVLEERQVEPLGSNQVQRIDVRFIAATSRDLAAMAAAGSFRADLYHRLNVLPIRLPALRERLGDLEALVDTLADDIAQRSGMPRKDLSLEALELLARHDWPGNIRELRNAIEQATLMTDDNPLTAVHFSTLVRSTSPAPGASRLPPAAPFCPCRAPLPNWSCRPFAPPWMPPAATSSPPRKCSSFRALRCTKSWAA